MTASALDVLGAAQRLQQQGRPCALVTVLRVQAPASARPGDKAVVTADGIAEGWIGGGCAQPAVLRTVRQALLDGRARVIRIAPVEEGSVRELDDVLEFGMACHSGGTLELFIDPLLPQARLVVIGDSPVAAALSGLAPRVGLQVTVIAHGADAARFPDAQQVIARDDASDDAEAARAQVAPGAWVVVATQGQRDVQGLRLALALQARQVSFVASARKAQVLRASLTAAGQDAAAVAAIVAPAGQAIGAQTPEEIALSVLAAVVAARRAATAAPITAVDSNPRPTAAVVSPSWAEAGGAGVAESEAEPERAAERDAAPMAARAAQPVPLPLPELPRVAGSCCGGEASSQLGDPAAVSPGSEAAVEAPPMAVGVAPAPAPKSCCGGA